MGAYRGGQSLMGAPVGVRVGATSIKFGPVIWPHEPLACSAIRCAGVVLRQAAGVCAKLGKDRAFQVG